MPIGPVFENNNKAIVHPNLNISHLVTLGNNLVKFHQDFRYDRAIAISFAHDSIIQQDKAEDISFQQAVIGGMPLSVSIGYDADLNPSGGDNVGSFYALDVIISSEAEDLVDYNTVPSDPQINGIQFGMAKKEGLYYLRTYQFDGDPEPRSLIAFGGLPMALGKQNELIVRDSGYTTADINRTKELMFYGVPIQVGRVDAENKYYLVISSSDLSAKTQAAAVVTADLTVIAGATSPITPQFNFTGTGTYSVNGATPVSVNNGSATSITVSNGDTVEFNFDDWNSVTRIFLDSDDLSGDLSGVTLPSTLTHLQIFTNSFSGDISSWSLPSTLQYLLMSFNSLSGDVSGWTIPTGLIQLALDENSFSGDISGWSLPNTLALVHLYFNSFSGDISGWTLPTSLSSLRIFLNSLSGDISGWTLPSSLSIMYIQDNSFTYGSTSGAFTGITASLTKIDFDNNSLSSANVDNALVDCDTSGISGKTIDIGGDNQSPGAAGTTAKGNLEGNGWAVNV